ncbi:MAG: hypothetical protein PHN89_02770 [Candidatus Pacebacteria bacterium]|nr:hypothetical protein [Candidatus Paceibacterota bacterium]
MTGIEIIFGAIVSLIVAGIKKLCGTTEWATLAVVFVVSLMAAVIYFVVYNAGYWETALEILAIAGAVYAYILERFKKDKN